MAKTHRKQ